VLLGPLTGLIYKSSVGGHDLKADLDKCDFRPIGDIRTLQVFCM